MCTQEPIFINDEALVLSFQNGNMDACSELYNRYFQKVYQKCFSFTKNTQDAADLSQDVFVKVIENLPTFKGQSKFSTWLYAITFNYCTDLFRRHKNIHFINISEEFDLAAPDVNIEDLLAQEKKENAAFKLLEDLRPEDREMLVMKYQMKVSIKEIERSFNLSSSAVKMRLSRAKSKVGGIFHLASY